MAKNDRFMDDMARMAGSAVSLLSTVRQQIKSDLKDKVDTYTGRMDTGHESEIEHLRAMVTKLRLEQESMKKAITELQGKKTAGLKAKPKKPSVIAKSKKKTR